MYVQILRQKWRVALAADMRSGSALEKQITISKSYLAMEKDACIGLTLASKGNGIWPTSQIYHVSKTTVHYSQEGREYGEKNISWMIWS